MVPNGTDPWPWQKTIGEKPPSSSTLHGLVVGIIKTGTLVDEHLKHLRVAASFSSKLCNTSRSLVQSGHQHARVVERAGGNACIVVELLHLTNCGSPALAFELGPKPQRARANSRQRPTGAPAAMRATGSLEARIVASLRGPECRAEAMGEKQLRKSEREPWLKTGGSLYFHVSVMRAFCLQWGGLPPPPTTPLLLPCKLASKHVGVFDPIMRAFCLQMGVFLSCASLLQSIGVSFLGPSCDRCVCCAPRNPHPHAHENVGIPMLSYENIQKI